MFSFAGLDTVMVATLCPAECSFVVQMTFASLLAGTFVLAYALEGCRTCCLTCCSLFEADRVATNARDALLNTLADVNSRANGLPSFRLPRTEG